MKLLCLVLVAAFAIAFPCSAAGDTIVYFGTYSRGKSKGIYVSRLDEKTGALSAPELAAVSENPSFLALHPDGKHLYAVNEINAFKGEKAGSVSAFAIDPATHKLTPLNQQSARGTGPCHLVVDKAGKNVLVANYGGGSVAVLPLRKDGSLGEANAFVQHTGSSVDPKRQKEPHAHSINLDPANHFAFVPDLGLDKVMIYRFDGKNGTLTPNDPPFATVKPGSGPRHFAFAPDRRHAYVINEMFSTITAFAYDERHGALSEVQTISTLPSGFSGNTSTAHVEFHPSGKFLYGSNRGHDSIAVYSVDVKTGRITLTGHTPTQGKVPRNFGIDPSGHFLFAANQNTDNVAVFRIDQQTGALTFTGQSIEVGSPVCVKFLTTK